MRPFVQIASSNQEIEKIIELRYEILRKPWNQSFESASDGHEKECVNAFVTNEQGMVIACGRLQENNARTGQIRFMAVADAFRGKGLGKLVLKRLETIAKERGMNKIELQARENALEFYKKEGYNLKEKTFLLWGIIQHYLMEKEL